MQPNYKCAACGKAYTVKNAKPDGRYACSKCRRLLVPVISAGADSSSVSPSERSAEQRPAHPPVQRDRRSRRGGVGWVPWAVAAILIATGGYAVYRLVRVAPTHSSRQAEEEKAAAIATGFMEHGVQLTVEEPAGVNRKAEPVTSGVPLPRGCAAEASALSLLDEKSQVIRCQFTPLCRWPDGSIKWVLLDFLADVDAGAQSKYTLKRGASDASLDPQAKQVHVLENQRVVEIDTGVLHVKISKERGTIVDEAELSGEKLVSGDRPCEAVLVLAGNSICRAHLSKPDMVTVEDTGPVRACVRMKGKFVDQNGKQIMGGRVGVQTCDFQLHTCAWVPAC